MKKVMLDFIAESVAAYYGITKKNMFSKTQVHKFLLPRQLAMYLMHEEGIATLADIGRHFGKTHATVINSVDMVKNDIDHNRAKREDYYTMKNFVVNRMEVEFVVSKLLSRPSETFLRIKEALEQE